MIIETKRVVLRPWRESDAESLYAYASDPDIGFAAGWPPHRSVDESREVIRTVFAARETYAVELKSTGDAVGCCGVMLADGAPNGRIGSGEGEIGYWLGKPYWGRGLIPEAVMALLWRCFNELGLSAVWCGHYDGNDKSRRVIEKCGFVYHHTVKDELSPLGDVRTEHLYRMVREEFVLMHNS